MTRKVVREKDARKKLFAELGPRYKYVFILLVERGQEDTPEF